MSIEIEREGKTVSEAIISACEDLGVARDNVEVEILEKGSRGVLGIGSKNAKVRVTTKDKRAEEASTAATEPASVPGEEKQAESKPVSDKAVKAKEALETLLGHLVNPQKVNIVETDNRIKLEVKETEDKGLLIGKGGEMIRALEFIVGKISSKNCTDGRRKRISIDVDGYKNRKDSDVSKKVTEAINRVKNSNKPYTLEKFSSYERRIAYITLKKDSGVKYDTVVDGNHKKIVISPS